MNSYTKSYNLGYLSTDDRLKGNDTLPQKNCESMTNPIISIIQFNIFTCQQAIIVLNIEPLHVQCEANGQLYSEY